jgi:hypothetical protein
LTPGTSIVFAQQQTFEIDCEAVVTRVVDGDTTYVRSEEGFKAGETFKVRFADVNAPELYTPEGQEAKEALDSLIDGKEVILDIDDLYTYDKYGRVVAVIYLQADETKFMNVNYWLVISNYAEISDYDNEFDPSTWTLYVEYEEKETVTPTPVPMATIVINEVELNPAGADAGNEWVELYNPTASEVDLSDWTLTTTHGITVTVIIPEGTRISPNGYYVVSYETQWLDNEDESVILKNEVDVEVDRTPKLNDTFNDDRTWQRIPNGQDTDSIEDWKFQFSTRGMINGEVVLEVVKPIVASNPFLIDPVTGERLIDVTAGTTVIICSELTNTATIDISGIFMVQVKDAEGKLVFKNFISLSIPAGKTHIASIAWTPEEAGTFTITIWCQKSETDPTRISNEASSTIIILERLPEVTVEGAVFTPPKELEKEIVTYKEEIAKELPVNNFVLLTQKDAYLIFSKKKPIKSLGYIEGKMLPKELEWKDISFTVIVADRAIFKVDGEPTTISKIRANPNIYSFKLVKLETNLREASIITYYNDQPIIHLTSGVVTDEPAILPDFLSKFPLAMKSLSEEPSRDSIKSLLGEVREKTLSTFNYDDVEFWKDSTAEVNCIVLVPEEDAAKFLKEIEKIEDIVAIEDILLYKVKLDLNPISVSTVAEINSNPDKFLGKTVSFTANIYDVRVSVKKLCEKATKAITGREVKYPADVILHTAIAWNKLPMSEKDILLLIGASSHVQDQLVRVVDGLFKLEGKVVSAKEIDESLSEKPVLLVFRMEKVGEIDYEALAVEARNLIEKETSTLKEAMESLILGKPVTLITPTPPAVPTIGLVNRDLPEAVSEGETFKATLNYTAKVPAVGLVITEYLPAGVKFIEAKPEPVIIKEVTPPTQILEKLGFNVPHVTMLKWLFYSKEPLKETIINYKATYSPELLPKVPRALPFHGEYEAADAEGNKYTGITGGDLVLRVEVGLPGPWDDDGKVTDSEILDTVTEWAKGKVSDIDVLKLIQLWVKTVKEEKGR